MIFSFILKQFFDNNRFYCAFKVFAFLSLFVLKQFTRVGAQTLKINITQNKYNVAMWKLNEIFMRLDKTGTEETAEMKYLHKSWTNSV